MDLMRAMRPSGMQQQSMVNTDMTRWSLGAGSVHCAGCGGGGSIDGYSSELQG